MFLLLLCAAAYCFQYCSLIDSALSPHFNDLLFPPSGCTTICVGPKATVNEAALVTHTNDCKDCDFRLQRVAASKHDTSDKRLIRPARFAYPRYIEDLPKDRLVPDVSHPELFDWRPIPAAGDIPQEQHTHAYIDGSYPIINSKGLSMGESTCAARFVAAPVFDNGSALFDVSELMRVAMERCSSAVCAVKLMGSLAETYGYYGAEWLGPYAAGESGEAVTIADSNQVWVFHISPDDSGKSAVWVAQRVLDDHVAVVANAFTIKQINLSDSDNFLASSNLFTVAEHNGLWNSSSGVEFDFAQVYGAKLMFDVYCSRRMWRVYDLLAPCLKLSSEATLAELPFSVRVEQTITAHDLMRIQRDHYEGTEYDLTSGLAAGPFGSPNRYDRGEASGLSMAVLMQGTFERAISLFRTAYSFVTESRDQVRDELKARVWFAPSIPHASYYTPLYIHTTHLPDPYTVDASLYAFDRRSAWWIADFIGNWMDRDYMHMQPIVKQRQLEIEQEQQQQIDELEQRLDIQFKHSHSNTTHQYLIQLLTDYQISNAQCRFENWSLFADSLVTHFHDGYRLDSGHVDSIDPTALFYPKDWLLKVGFFPDDEAVDWNRTEWSYSVVPGKFEDPSLQKRKVHNETVSSSQEKASLSALLPRLVLVSLVSSVLTLIAGLVLGHQYAQQKFRQHYELI